MAGTAASDYGAGGTSGRDILSRQPFCAGGKRPCKSDGRKADCAPVYDVSDVVFGVAGTCTGRAHGSSAAVYPDIPSEGSTASCDGDRDDSGGTDVRRGWCNGGGAKQVRSKKNVRCRWKSGVCRAAGFVYTVRAAGVTKQLLIVRGSFGVRRLRNGDFYAR